MKLVKKQSKQTYVSSKDGKEHHYYNYYLETDDNKRVQIKCVYKDDVKILDFLSIYER